MKSRVLLLSAVLFSINTTCFSQGSLTPPGTPAPTMKSLDQIQPRTPISSLPFTITNGGSYYVTTNLTAPVSTSGITISADNVAVDLNGFTLVSGGGSSSGGIVVPVAGKNVRVRNGSLINWAPYGINATNASSSAFEDLTVLNSGSVGLAAGDGCTLIHCLTALNNLNNILIGNGSSVIGCIARYGNFGIQAGNQCTIDNCIVSSNFFGGIVSGQGCNINRCTAVGNGLNSGNSGISTTFYSVVKDCVATGNAGYGIISHFGSCTISGCTADSNTNGISASDYSIIQNCTTTDNLTNGIMVTTGCLVTGNVSAHNGLSGAGTGIIASGSGNRIDGNLVRFNLGSGGISVPAANANIVVRNTSSGNSGSNYSPSSGTGIGPVLDPSTTTNAFANF